MSEPQVAPFHATPFEQVDMSVGAATVGELVRVTVVDEERVGEPVKVIDDVGVDVRVVVVVDEGEAPGDIVDVGVDVTVGVIELVGVCEHESATLSPVAAQPPHGHAMGATDASGQ